MADDTNLLEGSARCYLTDRYTLSEIMLELLEDAVHGAQAMRNVEMAPEEREEPDPNQAFENVAVHLDEVLLKVRVLMWRLDRLPICDEGNLTWQWETWDDARLEKLAKLGWPETRGSSDQEELAHDGSSASRTELH